MRILDALPPPEKLRRRARALARNVALSTLCGALLGVGHAVVDRVDRPAAPPSAAPVERASVATDAPSLPGARTIRGVVRAGRGFAENLALAGLEPGLVRSIVDRLRPSLDYSRLKTGDRFTVVLDRTGDLVSLTYEMSPVEAVVLRSTPAGWATERAPLPVETRFVEVRGTIRSSLFEAMDRAGEDDSLTGAFAELFAWDIDFSHELQPGDSFRTVVEKVYREGRFVRYGRILAAEYRDRDHAHRAYFFPWPDARGDWYTPEGRSVRASFLRSPISYTRISSGFSLARRHPLLNVVRPHLGVDFAAPVGTPVWAPADGIVTALGRDEAGGNRIALRHAGSYESHYLHLSRFASGLRVGSRVRQKEVIGYVGSTGLSTGPHLDYRVRRGGTWVNPTKENFPRGERLPESFTAQFAAYRTWLDALEVTPLDGAASVAAR